MAEVAGRSETRSAAVGAVRRNVWAVVDQAAVAGMSFVLAFSVARQVSPDQFGRFALLQVVLTMGVYAYRELPGTWILVCPRKGSADDNVAAGAMGTAIVAGAGIGGCLLALGLAQGAGPGVALCMAGAVPANLVLQGYRLLCYRRGRVAHAATVSLAALLVFLLAVVAAETTPQVLRIAPVELYLCTLGAMCVVCLGLLRQPLSLTRLRRFVRDGRRYWGSLSGNVALTLTRQGLVPFVCAGAGSLAAVAGLRGAQSLSGLPQQVPQGMAPLFVAKGSVFHERHGYYPGHYQRRWWYLQLSILGPAFVLSWFVPDQLGEALLGQTWPNAKLALPWVMLGSLFSQLTLGADVQFKVEGRVRVAVLVRAATLPVSVVCVAMGAHWYSAQGAAVGFMLGTLTTLIGVTWARRRRHDSHSVS